MEPHLFVHASVVMVLMLCCPHILAQADDSSDDTLQEFQDRVTCLESTVDRLVSVIGSQNRPRDCRDVYYRGGAEEDGVYMIWPDGSGSSRPVRVLCHFDTEGQWIVLQRRYNGALDFAKLWADYRNGFGRVTQNSEFWLGLESMHQITRQQQYTLRVDLVGWDNQRVYAEYSIFYIDDEEEKYAIHYEGYSGTAVDAMGDTHRDMKFTTSDQDNDPYSGNCAPYHGPWWLGNCDSANLNGRFGQQEGNRGIEWGGDIVWKESTMRIRPTLDP